MNLRLSRSSELHYGPKQEAIARLDEKALRGGGKSEDQPLLEKMPKPSMEGLSAKADLIGIDRQSRENSLFDCVLK